MARLKSPDPRPDPIVGAAVLGEACTSVLGDRHRSPKWRRVASFGRPTKRIGGKTRQTPQGEERRNA
jgi:hypothetical protein